MNNFIDYLKYKDLISCRGVNTSLINRLSSAKVLDHAKELIQSTELKTESEIHTTFSHCASISLAGGRSECEYIGCRLERLENLARFAAFYSDRVYIRNFFSDYVHYERLPDEELKRRFIEDVFLSYHMRPLIEKGIVRFISETGELCPDCLAASLGIGRNMGKKFLSACHKLEEDFFHNTSFNLITTEGNPILDLMGPELYYEHGGIIQALRGLPKPIRSNPRIMKAFKRDGRIKLSKTISRKLEIHKALASEVVHNIAYHLFINTSLNTSFLTDKELHLEFLRYATDDKYIDDRNSIAFKHLTTLVPFAGDVKVKDLLKLRNREQDSFFQFRSSLNESIDAFRTSDKNFTERTARAIYSDIIAPELARLEKRVKSAKRDLISTTTRSLVGMVGAISFGLFTGLITAEVAKIAQAIGIVSFGADSIKKIMALGDKTRSIENANLYFLWKAKKLAYKSK